MYARVTNFQCDPARLDEMAGTVGAISAQVGALPGIEAAYAVWGDDGVGVVTAIYDSRESVEAAASKVQEVWAQLGRRRPRLRLTSTSPRWPSTHRGRRPRVLRGVRHPPGPRYGLS